MHASVILISKDQATRLRLTLASLVAQRAPRDAFEVIVVDDGSSDETPRVLDEYTAQLPLQALRNQPSLGISPSRNRGASVATGDVLLFMDGDNLAGPDLVASHLAAHAQSAGPVVGRGATYHLRCTRFFADPELGTPRPGEEARVARMAAGEELAKSLVTRDQVMHRFEEVRRRASSGIYQGTIPSRLYDEELRALREDPDSGALWMTVPGCNVSIARRDFEAIGGYDRSQEPVEHREIGLRLMEQRGARVVPVMQGESFHLTHKSGGRDPLAGDTAWKTSFHRKHGGPRAKLLTLFWQTLANPASVPERERIQSIVELERIVLGTELERYLAASSALA